MRPSAFQLLTVLACAGGALGQEPKGVSRVLLDRQLGEHPVTLVGLDGRAIMYTDAAGLVRNESAAEYLAIVSPRESAAPPKPAAPASSKRAPEPEPTPARASSTIELADGERFFGDIAPEAPPKDAVRWLHPTLGTMEFKFDQVRRIRLDMPPPGSWGKAAPVAAPDSKDDVVIFANGDRATGFVESVTGTPRQLHLSPVGKGEARDVDLNVVREEIGRAHV